LASYSQLMVEVDFHDAPVDRPERGDIRKEIVAIQATSKRKSISAQFEGAQ